MKEAEENCDKTQNLTADEEALSSQQSAVSQTFNHKGHEGTQR